MSNTVTITSNYVVPAGESDVIEATASSPTTSAPPLAYLFLMMDLSGGHPAFTLLGSLQISTSQSGTAIWAIEDTSASSTVTIGGGASLSISAPTGYAIAYENYPYARGSAPPPVASSIENDGHVTVSAQTAAEAFLLYKGQSLVNTGTIRVSATDAGYGLTIGVGASQGGSSVINSGSIIASSTGGYAFGVRMGANPNESAALVNSGSITASGTIAEAVQLFGSPTSVLSVVNSGTLSGSVAIEANNGLGSVIHLTNSGQITGDVYLGMGPGLNLPGTMAGSEIWNTGHIDGTIRLDFYGNDLYDGRGGTHSGDLYLGTGTDTVFLGDDGETVRSYDYAAVLPKAIVIGGAGADTLIGGSGVDIFDGGAGDDHLDGGPYANGGGGPLPVGYYGKNTVSYASATGGVTVNLGLQGGPQNTISAGVDTLLNFQNLTGSDFSDHLTGDANANTIAGGHGNDVLTGGAGADTFVFAPEAGIYVALHGLADVVTDFSQAEGDRIDLSAFPYLRSLAQALNGAVQSGPDTVLHLGGATVTLDNVLLSSLTAQDFVFARLPFDFGQIGQDALLFRNAATGDWGFMSANPTGGETWHTIGASSADYAAIGKGDFNGDGVLDAAFRQASTGDWGFLTINPSGGEVWHAVGPSSLAYDAVAVGDILGDGSSEIVFRNGATGDWGFMQANGLGGQAWHAIGPTSAGYSVIGSGDFNGDGVFDVAFRQTSTGDWGYLSINSGGGETWHSVGPSSLAYQAVASASFLGDGLAQIAFRNPATGDWGFMQANASGGETWRPIGSTSIDYTVIGNGDFNGDGLQDVAFRQTAGGDWGFLSVGPTGGETWHFVGPSSLAYASI